MKEWLDFFATVHTSKGVYKQPKLAIDDFLESGERDYKAPKPEIAKVLTDEIIRSQAPVANVCDKSEDPEFIEKLKEALGFLTTGLPPGTSLKLAIYYAVNIIKKSEGREELWFNAISYQENILQAKLSHPPLKVKYQKVGSIIKPSLDKIEKFYFEEG